MITNKIIKKIILMLSKCLPYFLIFLFGIILSLKNNLNKRRIRNLLLHQKEESNPNQILSDIETNLKIEPFLDYLNKKTFYGDWFNNGKKI